jgi:hypothetical protein
MHGHMSVKNNSLVITSTLVQSYNVIIVKLVNFKTEVM